MIAWSLLVHKTRTFPQLSLLPRVYPVVGAFLAHWVLGMLSAPPVFFPPRAVWFSLQSVLAATRGILSGICIPTAWDVSRPKCEGKGRKIRWKGMVGRMRGGVETATQSQIIWLRFVLAGLQPCSWNAWYLLTLTVVRNSVFCRPWIFSPLRENWILKSKMNYLLG